MMGHECAVCGLPVGQSGIPKLDVNVDGIIIYVCSPEHKVEVKESPEYYV